MAKHALSFKKKTALVVSVVVTLLLALSVLLSPIYGEEVPWDSEAVFLSESQAVAVKADIEGTAHMLGEEFAITLIIQYDEDIADVDIGGLRNATLSPFNIVGDVNISHKNVRNSVYEYRYSTKLVAIDMIPGKAYTIKPISIEYALIETGEKRSFNVIPEIPFQIGSYYGGKTEGVEFRPPKPAVENNVVRAKTVLGISGILFALTAGAILIRTYFVKEKKSKEEVATSEADILLWKLERFHDREWLEQKSADGRLLELEPLLYRAAYIFFELSPTDLYNKEKESLKWRKALIGIDHAYAPDSTTYEKVEEVVHELDLLLRTKQTRKEGR
ncbi:MAG: hypothetical protein WDZ40_03145 [Candidatus Spechtbacterales bacterium]